jgi:hypothetical protein
MRMGDSHIPYYLSPNPFEISLPVIEGHLVILYFYFISARSTQIQASFSGYMRFFNYKIPVNKSSFATLYRKSDLCNPRNELRDLVPNFYIHVSVSDLYLSRYMNVEIGRQSIIFLFGINRAVQFHFWEYINRNQTFILDSHRPFIRRCLMLPPYNFRTHTQQRPD